MDENYKFYSYHYKIFDRLIKKSWLYIIIIELLSIALFSFLYGIKNSVTGIGFLILMDFIAVIACKGYEVKYGKMIEISSDGLYVYDYKNDHERTIPWSLIKSIEITNIAKSVYTGMNIHLFDDSSYLCIKDDIALEIILNNSHAVVINSAKI